MKNQEYRSILGQLPIKSPTPQDMAMLCPHLTSEEAVEAFTTDSGYVACPSLRIRHSFQVVSYRKEWVEEIKVPPMKGGNEDASVTGTKNHPAQLDWSHVSRTPESYADGKFRDDVFRPYKHMDRAMRFAEANWGDELILDDWKSVVRFVLDDPSDVTSTRSQKDFLRTKAVLCVTLSRELNTIINEYHKPRSELFDAAISQMTLNRFIWAELKAGHGGFIEFNCALCSGGLLFSSCAGCGHQFPHDESRLACNTPLSRKMVAFLRENGHEFKVDPEIVWKKEHVDGERARREHEEWLRLRQAQK